MANDTSTLIERLARDAKPVTPLPRPWVRAAFWTGVSLAVVAAITLLFPFQEAFTLELSDRRWMIEQAAALLTGITAAAAAFATTVPGYRRSILLTPLVPLAIWFGSVGQSCVSDILANGVSGPLVAAHWPCLVATVFVGALPAVGMAVMLRRGAPLTPHLTAIAGGVAAAGLANFGVRFVHALDTSLIVLVWHVGTLVAFSALAGVTGRSLLKWDYLRDTKALPRSAR